MEKNPWALFRPNLMAELFPGTREIVLVRDFRDLICSILAYNAKTKRVSFGRDRVGSDAEFVVWMRGQAEQLLDAHRERASESLLVRYEDLIVSTEETLERILSYLGIEDGPLVARQMITEARRDDGDAERQHITSPTVAASIGRWRRDLNEPMRSACEDAFRDILPAFGYS